MESTLQQMLASKKWFRVFHPKQKNAFIWGFGNQIICKGWGSGINDFINTNSGKYIFVKLDYNLKNDVEPFFAKLKNDNDNIELWMPQYIIDENSGKVLLFDQSETQPVPLNIEPFSWSQFLESLLNKEDKIQAQNVNDVSHFIDKQKYVSKIDAIKKHVQEGNIYEINFCTKLELTDVKLSPFSSYMQLLDETMAPYSAFVKDENNYIICASPERFIKKENTTLTAQPMKGTLARHKADDNDSEFINQLKTSEKERAENVMIVDLTRNDMSKIAQRDSVKVKELFGIHTFPHVYQMVSTICCEVDSSTTFTDIIQAMYPVGSMTGAPKVKAMELIDKFEDDNRLMFSGSLGLICPDGDFDLNVVIRSIFYDEQNSKAAIWAGGAITAYANANDEYNECLLKMQKPYIALINNLKK